MTHLGLALILFVALVWTALDAWSGSPRVEERTDWRGWALAFLGAVFFQSLLGALVAGNDAGLVYNDWPLMNGALVPAEYAGHGLWGTIAHSQGAVQLHHRLMAYALFVAAIVVGVAASRSRRLPHEAKTTAFVLVGVVCLQAGLGDLDPDGRRAAGPGRPAPGGRRDPAGRRDHLRLARATALGRLSTRAHIELS